MTFAPKTATLRRSGDHSAGDRRPAQVTEVLGGAAVGVNGIELCSRDGRAGQRVFTDEAWDGIALAFAFSPRELEIVRHIFDDHTEAAIARELAISPHTVHTYLERIYQKLKVSSRVQLVVRVVEQQNSPAMAAAVDMSRRSLGRRGLAVAGRLPCPLDS